MESGVIATGTFVNDRQEVRALLALKSVEEAHDLGYRIIVVDGSPGYEGMNFRQMLGMAGATVFEEREPGMGPARRFAIKMAMEAAQGGPVCWIEPEKGPIINHLSACFAIVESGAADIVVPCRSPFSWRSYPRLQQLNEPFGSYGFEMATGRGDLDMFFGPRVFNSKAAELFLQTRPGIPGGDSWGTTHYPVMQAIATGMEVVGVMVDYIHPPEQTAAEDNPAQYMRRVTQLDQLGRGTFLYAMDLGLMPEDPELRRTLLK